MTRLDNLGRGNLACDNRSQSLAQLLVCVKNQLDVEVVENVLATPMSFAERAETGRSDTRSFAQALSLGGLLLCCYEHQRERASFYRMTCHLSSEIYDAKSKK